MDDFYPKDPKAAELFSQLNTRYFDFADRLPPPLVTLARTINTFRGYPGNQPFENIASLNPVLAASPWLFWEMFQDVNDDLFLTIAEAGMLFVLASVILDHIVDGQGNSLDELCLFHQALYHGGVSKFREVLPRSSFYWTHFDRLAASHLKGLATELSIQSDPQQLTLNSLFVMAHGKVAPIVNTSAALSYASSQSEILSSIETSLNHIATASQLLDDIGDWKQDIQVRHLTYFLAQCAPLTEWQSPTWPMADDIQKYIDDSWIDTDHMDLVIKWLDEAVNAVQNLNCPAWIEYVNGYRKRSVQHLTNFYTYHLSKVFEHLSTKPL